MINFLMRYSRIALYLLPISLMAYTPSASTAKDPKPPISAPKVIVKNKRDLECLDRIKDTQARIKLELNKLKEIIEFKEL
tara:strand:- start:197 stop:436 length:240 start_codon:yes stop_codon:yes gene_type:complete